MEDKDEGVLRVLGRKVAVGFKFQNYFFLTENTRLFSWGLCDLSDAESCRTWD